jgi:Na+-driven multidrug efflux pump
MGVTDTLMVSPGYGADGLSAVAVGSDLHSILFYARAGVTTGLPPFYTAAAARHDAAERARLERLGRVLVGFCAAPLCPLVRTAHGWLAGLGIDPGLLETGRGNTQAMALTLAVMPGLTLQAPS